MNNREEMVDALLTFKTTFLSLLILTPKRQVTN